MGDAAFAELARNLTAGGAAEEARERISLNEAEREELTAVDGIGGARADALIRRRAEHGPFNEIDEIDEVADSEVLPTHERGAIKMHLRP